MAVASAARVLEAGSVVEKIEDGTLVRRALGGDPQAFEALVERYERAVYHLAYRTLHDTEDARDATQEAFFKAYRSLHTFKIEAKFSTWILSIAYHACCDRLAKRKRFSFDELPETVDPTPGPELLATRGDDARRLRDAIDALPEKYRVVITLYHLRDCRYEEIAEILGVPLGTVKTHLFRAKDLLRRRLADPYAEVTE